MFEVDRELTWLSSPAFAIVPDATSMFLAFLNIARSLRGFRGVGDSVVGTPTTSVGGSSYLLVRNEALKLDQHPRRYLMLLHLTTRMLSSGIPHFPYQQRKLLF